MQAARLLPLLRRAAHGGKTGIARLKGCIGKAWCFPILTGNYAAAKWRCEAIPRAP